MAGRVFLVCILLFVVGVRSWDCTGHCITANIALQLMPQHVHNYFHNMSRFGMVHWVNVTSLTEMACWLDQIKQYSVQYSPWHFFGGCYSPNDEIPCPVAAVPNIITILSYARKQVVRQDILEEDRAFWLGAILHLVGDAHEPLHAASLYNDRFPHGDVGGNLFFIGATDPPFHDLHAFHDSIAMVAPLTFPPRPLAQFPSAYQQIEFWAAQLIANTTLSQTEIDNLDPAVWIDEGSDIAQKYSYVNGTLPFNVSLTSDYIHMMKGILQRRVALGGHRLAKLLTKLYLEIFPSPPPEMSH